MKFHHLLVYSLAFLPLLQIHADGIGGCDGQIPYPSYTSSKTVTVQSWNGTLTCQFTQQAPKQYLGYHEGEPIPNLLRSYTMTYTFSNWSFKDNQNVVHTFNGPQTSTLTTNVSNACTGVTTITKSAWSSFKASSNDGWVLSVTGGPLPIISPANYSPSNTSTWYQIEISREGTVYPKFQILNVTYAPPGPSSTIDYGNSTSVGVSTAITNSFINGSSYSYGINVFGSGALASTDYTHTTSTTTTESTNKTTTYDLSSQNDGSIKCNFINHDFDRFDVWLNPKVEIKQTNLNNSGVFDTANRGDDPYLPYLNGKPQMDHVVLLAGWLNGNIPWPSGTDILERLSRNWDTTMPVASRGLTIKDFSEILHLDPWAQQIDPISGARLPYKSTTEIYNATMQQSGGPRYILINSIGYTPVMQTAAGYFSNLQENSEANTYTDNLHVGYSGSVSFISGLNSSSDWTWTHSVTVTTSTSFTNTAAYTINTPDINKPLPSASTVDIWQDNLYGTFMFAFPGEGF